jgi:hypothetical protein
MIVHTISSKRDAEHFRMPGFDKRPPAAFIYHAPIDELRALVSGWPDLAVHGLDTNAYPEPSVEDYDWHAGKARLFFDLVEVYGPPVTKL